MSSLVLIGLEHAPTSFNLCERIVGQGGANLAYIRLKTGAMVILKGQIGDNLHPLHLCISHPDTEKLASARNLALNLIETVSQQLQKWTELEEIPPSQFNRPPPLPPHVAPQLSQIVTQPPFVTQMPQNVTQLPCATQQPIMVPPKPPPQVVQTQKIFNWQLTEPAITFCEDSDRGYDAWNTGGGLTSDQRPYRQPCQADFKETSGFNARGNKRWESHQSNAKKTGEMQDNARYQQYHEPSSYALRENRQHYACQGDGNFANQEDVSTRYITYQPLNGIDRTDIHKQNHSNEIEDLQGSLKKQYMKTIIQRRKKELVKKLRLAKRKGDPVLSHEIAVAIRSLLKLNQKNKNKDKTEEEKT